MAPSATSTASAIEIALPDRQNGKIDVDSKAIRLVRTEGRAINEFPPDKPYSICIDTMPATIERRPYFPKSNDRLVDPGTARMCAASVEAPNGTTEGDWAELNKHRTVVQQHCSYWDKDNDGVIWPGDTYRGCRAWGWNPLLAFLAMFIINVNLSYPTCPSFIPDPCFRIYLKNIHKDKHGSDSMAYDNEGRFKPQQFEDIFAKYDSGNKGGLDVYDLARFHKGQRMAFDFFGWSATFLEWLAVYLLLWPEDGILRKDDVRRVYDGSIFQKKADEHAAKQRQKKAKRAGRLR